MQGNNHLIEDPCGIYKSRFDASPLVTEKTYPAKKDVPIVFCADAHYGTYLPVVVQSIIAHASSDYHYHIIIFDCGIKDEVVDAVQLQICQFNNFSLQVKNIEFWLEKHKEPLKTKNYWSAATYGRFAIPELCKEYGKVIYADVDMIFNRDIGELIEINLGSNYIAGVLDITEECRRYIEPKHAQYLRQELELNEENVCINAGLLLINVAVWRERDLAEKALALLKRKSFHLLDQDALCSLCRGKIYVLEDAWNNLAWPKTYIDKLKIRSDNKNIAYLTAIINNYLQAYSSEKVIFHYNTREKPWKYIKTAKADIWWQNAVKTPFFGRYIVDMLAEIEQRREADKEPVVWQNDYRLFGMRILTIKRNYDKKKYLLGGRFRIAKLKKGRENTYFYILGLKCFSVKHLRG